MKKVMLVTLVIGSVILTSGQALAAPKTALKAQVCPFQDNFTLQASRAGQITSLRTDGNVTAHKQNGVDFVVGCADNNNGAPGNIYLTVANTAGGQCQLTISDGPDMMNPMVNSVSCSGAMQYAGMNHNFGTFQYDLLFS